MSQGSNSAKSSSSELSYQEPEILSSIDEINEDIQEKYPSADWKKPILSSDMYGKPLSIDKFRSVNTSINRYDCLIHAFLIDVSPYFRALSNDEKDEYADWFRREMFIHFFDPVTEQDARQKVEGLDSTGAISDSIPLEEAHIQKLIDKYDINIIVFEKTGAGIRASVNLGGVDNIHEDEDFIIIYNPGDLHFRAVRDVTKMTPTNPGQFVFTPDQGTAIAKKYAVENVPLAKAVCAYSAGEKVLHNSEIKTIYEIVWPSQFDKQRDCIGVRFFKNQDPPIPLSQIQKLPAEVPKPPELPAELPKPAELPAELPKPAELPAEKPKVIIKGKVAPKPASSLKSPELPVELPKPSELPVELPKPSELPVEVPKPQVIVKGKTIPKPSKPIAAPIEEPSAPIISDEFGTTKEQLLLSWRNEKLPFDARNRLVQQMERLKIFPEEEETALELKAGLYPDVKDPNFVEKLMKKREFAESKQPSIKQQIEEGVNPCDPEKEFEISPVQRFVSRLLNPYTPYQSALLYHGVGVGKTCAAITIAEGYLEKYPRDQVYIIAPPNIQPGFERTIFDFDGLKIGKGLGDSETESEINIAKGCTGNTYLKLTGTLFEQDKKSIESRVRALIRRRYKLMGYTQFANEIEAVENSVPKKGGVDEINKKIRKMYSGKIIIIDEAHNLRDIPDETEEENIDAPGGYGELSDAAAGKKLTPLLRRILTVAEGITLVLLTGTPMYNSYSEIIFLLNLLLLNEKRIKDLLTKEKIFRSDGTFIPALKDESTGEPIPNTGGKAKLGEIAGRYVSFMRGENPLTFPIRLKPIPGPTLKLLTSWPTYAPNGKRIEPEGTEPSISEIERANRFELPLVECYFEGETAAAYRAYTQKVAAGGLGIQNANALVQAGNWIFPGDEDERIESRTRNEGFETVFEAKVESKQITFRSRIGKPTWLAESEIGSVSPKTKLLLNRLRTCTGCAFVYSRFVKSGALSIALALEANGYTPWGRDRGFLADGIQAPGGLQCARCPRKRDEHFGAGIDHKFIPAKYVLLTGSEEYSPNNPGAIATERRIDNMNGDQIKVVVGSQVVSEGVDLRFIREIYVFDSWFHLNKLEQVIGRGIRTCSHALIPDPKLRNCTVYLLVNAFTPNPDGSTTETMDLYTYRRAIRKAVEVGRVTRVLKEYAIDCNLNHDAILVTGITKKVPVIDAQGNEGAKDKKREADLNDTPFTALCDWEECDTYTCKPYVAVDERTANQKTYTEFAAKWQEQKLLDRVRKLFQGKAGESQQAFVKIEDFREAFTDISDKALSMLLQSILRSTTFSISLFGKKGKIIYKNGYFLFQPEGLLDDSIPLALRISHFPVKRDSYIPSKLESLPEAPKPIRPIAAPKRVVEEEPVEKEIILTDFWISILEWAELIRTETAPEEGIPPSVSSSVNIFFSRDEKLFRRSSERLGMVTWLYVSVKNDNIMRKQLASILEEIIWDEFLSPVNQMALLSKWKTNPADLTRFAPLFSEQVLKEGSLIAFRFVDLRTGAVRYICDEKECTELQRSVLEEGDANPVKEVKISGTNTGFLYGFLVPKKGELIFKNVSPPGPGAKVEKGQECSISSQVSDHLRKLKELGAAIKAEKKTDLDLNEEDLTGDRKFENAVRACFLMDLVLRLMDKQGISKKRWFYKSISSKLAGHKGTFEKGQAANT